MAYHLELVFEDYYVVDDDGEIVFIGDFESAVDKLESLNGSEDG